MLVVNGRCFTHANGLLPVSVVNVRALEVASLFFAACFTCTPDSIELVNWGTWHRC